MLSRYARTALGALALLAAPLAHAQNGQLDPTFSGDGVAFGPLNGGVAYDVVVDEQKGPVIVGSYRTTQTATDAFIARYNPDGTLDSQFNGDGFATRDFGGSDEALVEAAVDGNGFYVAAGFSDGRALVVRYLDDGRLDPAFGTGGIALFSAGGAAGEREVALTVAVGPGGVLYVGGVSGAAGGRRGFVARFTAAGVLDPTFGVGGVVRLPLAGSAVDSVAPTGDGRLVLTGSLNQNGNQDILVARLLASGLLDTTFSADGLLAVDAFGNEDRGAKILAGGDGALTIVGTGGSSQQSRVLALSLGYGGDPTVGYGTNGVVLVDASPEDAAGFDTGYDAAVDRDGRLVIAGTTFFRVGTGASQSSAVLIRLLPTGVRDTAFGTNGLVRTPVGTIGAYFGVAVDRHDAIYAAGEGSTGTAGVWVVARYTSGRTVAGEVGSEAATAAFEGARPNPLAATTALRYRLAAAAEVTLTVHDVLGREVARLAKGAQAAGTHEVRWDASAVAPGVYVARLQSGASIQTVRLTVAR